MYIPNAFKVDDRPALLAFMRQYSFATLVSHLDGELIASHLPLIIDEVDKKVILRGHFAKANPHWKASEMAGETLIIFQTPHAYISPSQYEEAQSVPTWNYVAVHAYGAMRRIDDPAAILATFESMFDAFDAGYRTQWQNLSESYRTSMLKGIVAFAIEVTRLEGKAKLSQNRPVADQKRVAEWLLAHEDAIEQEVGRLMEMNLQGG